MLGSYLYWITTAALVLCVAMSFLRRQTVRDLAESRKKLLDERQDREQMRAELVHVRSTAEKDLAAAKKQAAEAKAASTEQEQKQSTLAQERDALRAELDQVRTALADRTGSEESAKTRIAELEAGAEAGRSGVRASEDKLGELGRDVQAARSKVEALEKKLEGEARLRKVAEDERNTARGMLTALDGKQREAERSKTALAEAHAKELQALRDASSVLETELAAERSKVQTPPPSAVVSVGGGAPVSAAGSAAGGGDLLAAIDADPFLNRGQKETIRITYNQFTAKRRAT